MSIVSIVLIGIGAGIILLKPEDTSDEFCADPPNIFVSRIKITSIEPESWGFTVKGEGGEVLAINENYLPLKIGSRYDICIRESIGGIQFVRARRG